MDGYSLVIGSPRYSSWSLRAWLPMRHHGLAFEQTVIPLYQTDTRRRILQYSPAGKVPVLRHGAVTVWESLAILEYLAERHPELGLWPEDAAARALARNLSAEMHAGFAALRQALPMDLKEAKPGKRPAAAVEADIGRIAESWRAARAAHGAEGPFLFGRFGAADAMYAPVAVRFLTYGVAPDDEARRYCEALWALPAMAEWRRMAAAE